MFRSKFNFILNSLNQDFTIIHMLPQGWKPDTILGKGSYGLVRKCTIHGKQYAVKSQMLASTYSRQGLTPRQAVIEHDIGRAAFPDGTLARILGSVVESRFVHFVMPLYGPSVESIVASSPLPPKDMFYLIIDLGAALQTLHDIGIIHRDVKLSNIMINTSKDNGKMRTSYVLGDFGVANLASIASTCIGTPITMAPEIHTNLHYGVPVDVWGAGCCFYEAMVGSLPFSGASHRALRVRAAMGLSDRQKKHIKGVHDKVGELIIACLNPTARLRPNACDIVDRGLASMVDAGLDDRSPVVRSIPLIASKLQHRLTRSTTLRLSSMLPPFKHPVSSSIPLSIGSESIPPLEQTTQCTLPAPHPQRTKSAAKVQIEGVYPSVSHGQGRTPDFDNARYRGQRVNGYKYLGKVYVIRS
jgi:serine/threonine protein kinase